MSDPGFVIQFSEQGYALFAIRHCLLVLVWLSIRQKAQIGKGPAYIAPGPQVPIVRQRRAEYMLASFLMGMENGHKSCCEQNIGAHGRRRITARFNSVRCPLITLREMTLPPPEESQHTHQTQSQFDVATLHGPCIHGAHIFVLGFQAP